MTVKDRAKKLLIAIEMAVSRKEALELITQSLNSQTEDCATVADKRAEAERQWAKDMGCKSERTLEGLAAEKIAKEIREMKGDA